MSDIISTALITDLERHFQDFEIVDDNSLATPFLHRYVSEFLKHRKLIRSYYDDLLKTDGYLFRKIVHIYFNPDVNKLIMLIQGSEIQLRRHSFILYHLTCSHIKQVYPREDTHYQEFLNFINLIL